MKMKLMSLLNHKGSALLFTVIAITSIAVLGTGIYFMTTTSTFSGISANDQNRAYQLAMAGKEYALVRNFENTASLYPSGRDFTFDNGDKIRLVIDGDAITSTGIVKEGTPYEARRTITAKVFPSGNDNCIKNITKERFWAWKIRCNLLWFFHKSLISLSTHRIEDPKCAEN